MLRIVEYDRLTGKVTPVSLKEQEKRVHKKGSEENVGWDPKRQVQTGAGKNTDVKA